MGQDITIFIVLFLFAFIDLSLQAGIGPELSLDTPTVTVLANSTFEVECSGYFPLRWIYPADWRSLISTKANVTMTYHPNRIKPYVSALTITDLEYRFTGRYICASTIGPQPDEEDYEDGMSASIYLYVYDDGHLLTAITNSSSIFPSFFVFSSSPFVIPCRPTRPEIQVRLTGNEDAIQEARFDPRRGFIFEHPKDSLQGLLFCEASYENMNETLLLFLRFQAESTIVPSPTIDDTDAKHLAVGKPFSLDCIVHKDFGTPIYVFWKYPEGNEDIEVTNTTVRDIDLGSEEKAQRLSIKLIVFEATTNHTGNYTCTVLTPSRHLYFKTIFIKVSANNGPELSLVTPTVTILANSTFEVECSGYFPMQWIYPADWRSLITTKANVTMTHHPNKIKPYVSALTITDLDYRFTGRYICASTTGPQPDEEDYEDDMSASIYLYVYDDDHLLTPITNSSSMFPSFLVFPSSPFVIPCRPTRPEIQVQLTGDEEAIQGARFDPRRGFIFEHPNSTLHGMFHCEASYENMTETHMLVLRFKPERTIVPSPTIDDSDAKYPAVGKPFSLDCVVHKDLGTPVIVFWKYPEGNDDIELTNTTARDIELRFGQKAKRLSKKLIVTEATTNHTGHYTCIAITPRKKPYEKTIFIKVHANIGPELSVVNITVTVLANSTFEVECSGYFPLQWIYPADWRSLISTKANVTMTHHPNKIRPYVSAVTITDLEYKYTGRYICSSTIEPQADEEDYQDDMSASFYLYVYDGDHLLAPITNSSSILSKFLFFSSRPFVVPCRPTRPEIQVQLIGDEEAIQEARFDPRRGFIFEHPKAAVYGPSLCKASYENMTETLMLFLFFTPESTIVPSPIIDDTDA